MMLASTSGELQNMSSPDTHRIQFEKEAQDLIHRVSIGYLFQYEGSWTSSIYDSAWLAMIQKPDGEWLFPECFQYVLDQQLPRSGWPGYACEIDAILNTMAALLAIGKHCIKPSIVESDLQERKEHGIAHLQSMLQVWDIQSCLHVGFEILVPALLKMLEDTGIVIDFPGKAALTALNFQKLKHFSPTMLYSSTPMTAVHSLEAFIGTVDFSKLSHQLVNGSMLGSPSSTAAYLMNSPNWDADAEIYLRRCVRYGGGEASGFLEDADDTAKAIHILNALGHPTSCSAMVSHFQSPKGHMSTYIGERNLSPSANCNALICILEAPDLDKNAETVNLIIRSLCDHWKEGDMVDKWNLSESYTAMLLAQALAMLIQRIDSGLLKSLPADLLHEGIPLMISQLLNRRLFNDISTSGSYPAPESVAYETLACIALISLPLPTNLKEQLAVKITHGKSYLAETRPEWKTGQYLWIEKVTYGCGILSECYCLAASLAEQKGQDWTPAVLKLFSSPSWNFKLTNFFHACRKIGEPWEYEACIYEARIFTTKLQGARTEIFPSRINAKDEYLIYIPAAWVITNNMRGLKISANLLWEMTRFSMLDYLVDEYMESTLEQLNTADKLVLRDWIYAAMTPGSAQERTSSKRPLTPSSTDCEDSDAADGLTSRSKTEPLACIQRILGSYMKDVLFHPEVRSASRFDRENVRMELRDFLLAHIIQMEDNARLPAGSTLVTLSPPRTSFYTWSRSTGSQHTSALLSFAFYSCLLTSGKGAKGRQDCFPGALLKYHASDLASHLAVMSRLFNDWSSIQRDLEEGNVNSLHFPEFWSFSDHEHQSNGGLNIEDERAKDFRSTLLCLSEFERQASRVALAKLAEEMRAEQKRGWTGAEMAQRIKAIELFAYVTELFADMYIAKDLTNRVRGN
ncbi:hypothetical protein DM02DRAFT_731392 [Periconia macrospinosa]|uniref:Ent-kaurene synthase n=1 Tax=Periconia macrospinosa TaxID=97972 RepID=A0A2V1DG76_9PLEO|nr:hypothetical protein DM02DRAFT_731392 [Periconia macrospinosa]